GRGQRLGVVVARQDRRLPREKVGIPDGERAPALASRTLRPPLVDEEEEGERDRLVVEAGIPLRRREAAQRRPKARESREETLLAEDDPRRADVVAVVERLVRKRRGLEGGEEGVVGDHGFLFGAGRSVSRWLS